MTPQEVLQRESAPAATPRKRFSLTRARPSRARLDRRDRLRALVFAAGTRLVAGVAGRTMRLRAQGEDALARARGLGPGSLLLALWHGDYFPLFRYARGSGICVVVSRSPDGEILDRLLKWHGYRTVRGSTTLGATQAVVDLARHVRAGADAAIALDGPRGPLREAKPGIVLLAKMTGCPIIPLGAGMRRFKQFGSWDRFRLPLPFSRVVLSAGEPICVPRDATADRIEQTRLELERALSVLRERTNELVGDERFHRLGRPRGFATTRL